MISRLRSALGFGLVYALAATARAQAAGPDPREIPVPPIATNLGAMPDAAHLPVRTEMPDVLVMDDGTRVTTRAQWARRREEIRRTLAYYAVGRAPPPPGNVKGTVEQEETASDGAVRYRRVHLAFGPGEKLGLEIGLFTPAGPGPFPAIILQAGTPPGATALPRLPQGPNQGKGEDVLLIVGGAPKDETEPSPDAPPPPSDRTPGPAQPAGSSPMETPVPRSGRAPRGAGGLGRPATVASMATQYAAVFHRGYALVVLNPNDCAEDTTLRNADGSWAFRNTRFFPAYPGYDWGILAAWAWGVSRVADFLVTDPSIDAGRLIVTGASRNGKSSMIAAAFDDRLMGAPVVTGGGGIGAYRYAGPHGSETLDIMMKKYPNWFSPHLHEFWGQREKLPFDEHWFLALCAPRPFIALEGDSDTISLPDAVMHSMLAAQPAYSLFGAVDRLGVNYARHAHAFTQEDWTAMMDFADRNLRGMPVTRTFDHFPLAIPAGASDLVPERARQP